MFSPKKAIVLIFVFNACCIKYNQKEYFYFYKLN